MNAKTNETRQHILDVGYQLILSKGFTAVGLSELLKAADVPKGSFYHYFKSKEHFGEVLIACYFEGYMERIEALFCSENGTGYERLMSYFNRWLDIESGRCNAHKCLVVKLGAEVSDLSETMRSELLTGAERIVAAIAKCIELGIEDGSIAIQDSLSTASAVYQQWLGASLLSKLSQDTAQLRVALSVTEQLLKRK
ncbi:TetR/AcrR family transcriptional regulator [Vibrio sp. SCSIO 43133]|uniref:TetR/AcrR family transcriptional regulator n=1 Tax=Vibrio sp. SCSIO 43133 TaxID=2802577 RepID=UPI002076504F|nr:TetR/AcrR family transcriptional regulator [Vibrio sp. SCSIO 43133]USE03912.1 TetR/AcrR family transcriptional regulator [Vibrio sp. SCSIO 43133]